MKETRAPAILLIDDNSGNLENLTTRVRRELNELEAHQVRAWDLRDVTDAPETAFANHVGMDTVLVVTDLELSPARAGFLGDSVVAWCRKRFIPVGDFSRQPNALPLEPDLFELRVPRNESEDVPFIARMYRGFRDLRDRMDGIGTSLNDAENPGQLLAGLLERTELENQFSPYMTRPGMFNASLLDTLSEIDANSEERATDKKKKLLNVHSRPCIRQCRVAVSWTSTQQRNLLRLSRDVDGRRRCGRTDVPQYPVRRSIRGWGESVLEGQG